MSEFQLQKYVVQLLRLTARPDVVWFAVPNGEYRSKRTAARLKAMGVIPGVADICIVTRGLPRFLELKAPGGRQSAEQRDFEGAATAAGARYALVRSPEEARDILFSWGAVHSYLANALPTTRRAA